ncbi:Ig-like domain repeat protein [Nocardioides terrisoli]|uniref:Ig-like domain repeat protein n=1 Tax=Nocardioides terrisoli TaxID=3388267 RepID=UPI00287B904A|nr:Ig-like domain repeat protein [Nocardioides marmorisolisilvae]
MLLTAAVMALPGTSASAGTTGGGGTIVYVHAHNVWIATPDGRVHKRLTTNGTAAHPYEYPSEDDHGHVLAIRDTGFVVLDQAGHVLHSYAAPTVGFGFLEYASISPDGSTIGYASGAVQTDCGFVPCHTFTDHSWGYIDTATGRSVGGDGSPDDVRTGSWLGNKRTLLGDTVNTMSVHPATAADKTLWFTDCDYIDDDTPQDTCPGNPGSEYWHLFPEASPSGTAVASVVIDLNIDGPASGEVPRTTFLDVLDTPDVRTGNPPGPPTAPRCTLPGQDTGGDGFPGIRQATIQTPSWSPDGSALAVAFKGVSGWQVWRIDVPADVSDCGSYGGGPIIDDATQPRWSPAPYSPPAPVTRRTTRTALTVSSHRIRRHHRLRLTVHVSPRSSTGAVRLFDRSRRLGRVSLHRGVATWSTKRLRVGKHRLRAAYVGDVRSRGSRSKTVLVKVRR